MNYQGHIKNGVPVLDSPVDLPDGTPVRVKVERTDADFWRGRSVEELAREQGVMPIGGLDQLAGDWPSEDSIDEFLAFLREARTCPGPSCSTPTSFRSSSSGIPARPSTRRMWTVHSYA